MFEVNEVKNADELTKPTLAAFVNYGATVFAWASTGVQKSFFAYYPAATI